MKALVVVMLAALATPADAQDLAFGALEDRANVATVTTGLEYGLTLGAAYARIVTVADRPIVLGGDLTLVWAEADLHDFRLRGDVLAPIVDRGPWKLIGGVTALVRGTHDDIARMVDVGAGATLLAGRYAPRWFAAAELGFDWALATHVAPTDLYRMLVYPDARDGWYGNTGGMFRAGIQGGVSFGAHDVVLRAGRLFDIAGNPALLPFYGTLGFATHW